MSLMQEQIALLIDQEGLDDFETLLTPREWDEVPFVSRLDRIGFLAGLDVVQKSSFLLAHAVRHLDRIVQYAEAKRRTNVVVMVSVANWEDLHAKDPDPTIPSFWISTNPQRDLAFFRLRHPFSREANLVVKWLQSADLLRTHEVFDAAKRSSDPELRRVYVAQRGSAMVKPLILP